MKPVLLDRRWKQKRCKNPVDELEPLPQNPSRQGKGGMKYLSKDVKIPAEVRAERRR